MEFATELERVQELQRQVLGLDFKARVEYLVQAWGRIQLELGFLNHGTDETELSAWAREQLDALELLSHRRLATKSSFALDLKLLLRGGVVLKSSFGNADYKALEEEEDEEEDGEEEFDFEEDEDEDEDGEEEFGFEEDEDDEDEDEDDEYDEDEGEDNQDHHREGAARPEASRASSPPAPKYRKCVKSEFKLDLLDPNSPAPVPLVYIKFTSCASHINSEHLFFDDLQDDDEDDEEQDEYDEEEGPLERFYSSCGLVDSKPKWEDDVLSQHDQDDQDDEDQDNTLELDSQVCKCLGCGATHRYTIRIHWPRIQLLGSESALPSTVVEAGRSLPAAHSAYAVVSRVRTLALLLVLSGAGSSGHALAPLEFLFQSLLSDVFDRFTTRKYRFDATLEPGGDPTVDVD